MKTLFRTLLFCLLLLFYSGDAWGQVIIQIDEIVAPMDFDPGVGNDYAIVDLEEFPVAFSDAGSRFRVDIPDGISDLHLSLDSSLGEGALNPSGFFQQSLFANQTFGSDGLSVDLDSNDELVPFGTYFHVLHNVDFDLRATVPVLLGDFNFDGNVDNLDIDLILDELVEVDIGDRDLLFDLTGDETVDEGDSVELVEGILGTHFGDANLDGFVDRLDASVAVRNLGSTDAGWLRADFTGEGDTGLVDMSIIQGNLGLGPVVSPPAAAGAAAVPEPSSMLLGAFGSLALLCFSRRRSSPTR